ncbi:MAG: hypothetical protein ACKOBY_00345 [Cyanobium sp.]
MAAAPISPRGWSRLLGAVLGAVAILLLLAGPWGASPAQAAEVLQVRGPTLLQLGDRNRSYSVELVCLEVREAQQQDAIAWLRDRLPRRTRVNLQPMGEHDGLLMARVQRLNDESDLAGGLIAAGLADPSPCPWA